MALLLSAHHQKRCLMSPLRRRMIEDMTVRNLSPYTQRNYLFAVSRFVCHVRTSPADVGPEQLRDYLNHLVERKISPSYFNVNVAALRFLYTVVLERDWVLPKLPLQKRSPRRVAVPKPQPGPARQYPQRPVRLPDRP